jgi:hypothetical protein
MRSSHYLVFSRPRSQSQVNSFPRYDRWSNSHDALALDVGARRCLKGLVGDFFVGLGEFGGGVGAVVHRDYPSSLAKCCSSSGSLATLAAITGEELRRRVPGRSKAARSGAAALRGLVIVRIPCGTKP